MSSKGKNLKENREMFTEAKNKEIFEAQVDKDRLKVQEKDEEKAEKHFEREHK